MLTRDLIRNVAVCAAILSCTSAPAPAPAPAPKPAPAEEYSGLYTSTLLEDHFVPCGVRDVGDGWSLKFRKSREAPFLKRETAIQGYPPLSHFIRIRGTLGPVGRYNLGFQTREFTVDAVLDVKETPQPCESYEDAPESWSGVPQKDPQMVGVALSDDRTLAAVMSAKGRIGIWDTDRGRLLRELASPEKRNAGAGAVPMVFSPNGKLLAVGGVDGTVRMWRPLTGEKVYTFTRRDSTPGYNSIKEKFIGPTIQLAFNKSGTILAGTNGASTLIWSLRTGKRLGELNLGNGYSGRVIFLGDSSMLASGGDSSIRMIADAGQITIYPSPGAAPVWSAKTGARTSEFMTASPDRQRFATNGRGDSIVLWSVAERVPGPAISVPSWWAGGGTIAFSPDGNTMATSGGWYGLYLWDTRTGAPIRSFHKYRGEVMYAWFSADGKSIISLSRYDDQLRIVHLDPRSPSLAGGDPQKADSANGQIPSADAPANRPRTVAVVVTGPDKRAVPDAEVTLSNGDSPDVVLQRSTTSPGGYASFNGIRFPHVIFRVRKPGFETGVLYIHLQYWEQGPFGMELKQNPNAVPSK